MFSTFAKALLACVAAAGSGDYSYTKAGSDWGSLDQIANNVCGTGKEQSPIDLKWDAALDEDLKIVLNDSYQDTTMTFPELWNTIQVSVNSGGFTKTFSEDKKNEFMPLQFHFHAPSEHTIEGKHMDLEMHIVHQAADGQYAVLGFFFDQDKAGKGENLFIDQVMPVTYALNNVNGKNEAYKKVSLKGFIESVWMGQFWSYNGSLTTPPCTEGIKWSVLSEIQPISEAQLAYFTSIWKDNDSFASGNGNNRKVQPLNDRELNMSWNQDVHSDDNLEAAAITLGVLFALVTVGLIVVLVLAFCKPQVFGLEKVAKSVPAEDNAAVESARKLKENQK